MIRVSLALTLCGFMIGCGGESPSAIATKVKYSGTVKFSDGTPIKDVNIAFQPAGSGLAPCGTQVGADGTFSGEGAPGKYLFYFGQTDAKTPAEKGKYEAAIKLIPEKYKSAAADREVTLGSEPLNLTVTK